MKAVCCMLAAVAAFVFTPGCASSWPVRARTTKVVGPALIASVPTPDTLTSHEAVRPASHDAQDAGITPLERIPEERLDGATAPLAGPPDDSLVVLELLAIEGNATLRRMRHEAAALWSKTDYVRRLPDPTLSSMFFLPPMNFEPDRQVAELQVMQMVPWLQRLDAESQRAHFEALVAENDYQAERLRVVGELRTAWFRLYVLGRQVATIEADQTQLESLIATANARVATGDAQPGDVLMATLELSSLREQLLENRQQIVATTAELNRLLGRPSGVPIAIPNQIDVSLPAWSHDLLSSVAHQAQPELNAARLKAAATRWGIEIARLKRRPDVTLGAGWIAMDAPGATMPGAGRDSLTLTVSTNLPMSRRKYEALVSEASWEHYAAHASEDEVALRLDAALRDLWEQAVAADETVRLYESSILPQARQTIEANQKSLANNAVPFDRVIRDYRTLLSLELGYHRARGQLATAVARIRQTVGVDLITEAEEQMPPVAEPP